MPYKAPAKAPKVYRRIEPPEDLEPAVRKEWLYIRDSLAGGAIPSLADADLVTQLAKARRSLSIAEKLSTAKKLPARVTAASVRRDLKFWSYQVKTLTSKCKFFRDKTEKIVEDPEENPFEKLLEVDFSKVNTKIKSKWVDAGTKYAQSVVDGKVPACHYIKMACHRHFDDLTKSKTDFQYKFSPYLAHRVCEFISKLPHVKGRWARQRSTIDLEPWQCFIVMSLFGWVHKTTNLRRFVEAYLEICRKNGKSILAAAICLYMFCADGEYGAEIYSGATTEKQAWEVFRPARMMALATPQLLAAAGITVNAKSLVREADGSRFEPVIGKPGDGSSPSCAVADELHEHDTPDLVDTMTTGMGAREQPLMLCITTAGFNLAGPCYERRSKAIKILERGLIDERIFCAIYTIDVGSENAEGEEKGDNWADPTVLAKANPNLGISVDEEFLLSAQRSAVQNLSEQTKFKTKHLNVWCAARQSWVQLQQWLNAADPSLTPESLAGCDCWFSFDLASKSDIAAFVKIFTKPRDDMLHYYIFGRYYLPEDKLDAPGKNQMMYRKWFNQGLLTITSGATTDFDRIKDDIVDDARKFNPGEVVYDPFNATHMSQLLEGEGLTLVEFTQKPQNFAVPMDEVDAALKDGRLHHSGDEMLTWMISNVTVRPAKKGLFWPTKESEDAKIDAAVGMIMGVARAMNSDSGAWSNPFGEMVVA